MPDKTASQDKTHVSGTDGNGHTPTNTTKTLHLPELSPITPSESQSSFLGYDTRLVDAANNSTDKEPGERTASEDEDDDDDITHTKKTLNKEKPRRASNRAKQLPTKNYKELATGKSKDHKHDQKHDQRHDHNRNNKEKDNDDTRVTIELDRCRRELIKENESITLVMNEEKTLKVQAERRHKAEIEINRNLRKEYKELEAKHQDLQKATKKLEDAYAELVMTNDDLREDTDQEIEKMKKQGEKQKKEINQLTSKYEEMKKSQHEREASRSTIKNQEKVVKEQAEKIKNLEDLNHDLLQEITKNMTESCTKKDHKRKYKVTLLADSNGPNIIQTLEKNEETTWESPCKLYTADQILEHAKNNKKTLEQSNAIAILCGTNHIKRNEHPTDIIKKLEKIIDNLPKDTPKILIHIPSFKTDRKANLNVEIINYMMEEIATKKHNTHIANYRTTTYKAINTNDSMHDELHLNRKGTAITIITNSIIKTTINAITNRHRQKPKQPHPLEPGRPRRNRNYKTI